MTTAEHRRKPPAPGPLARELRTVLAAAGLPRPTPTSATAPTAS